MEMRPCETSQRTDGNLTETASLLACADGRRQRRSHPSKSGIAHTASFICRSCHQVDRVRKINAVLVAEASDTSKPQPPVGPSYASAKESRLTAVGTYTTFFGRKVIVLSQRLGPPFDSSSWGLGSVVVTVWGSVGLSILSAGIDIPPILHHSAFHGSHCAYLLRGEGGERIRGAASMDQLATPLLLHPL